MFLHGHHGPAAHHIRWESQAKHALLGSSEYYDVVVANHGYPGSGTHSGVLRERWALPCTEVLMIRGP